MHRLCVCSQSGAVAAIGVLAPDIAFADSVIDGGAKPYFVMGGALAALVFLGTGLFLLSKAMRYRRMAAAAKEWPVVEGRVIAAEVVKHTSKSDDEFDSYVPRVRYIYVVNGIRREGHVIRIGLDDLGYGREQQAREHIAHYPVGATVAVRHDPHEPEIAMLETGQVGATRYLFAAILLAGVGLGAIVFAIWSASLPVR